MEPAALPNEDGRSDEGRATQQLTFLSPSAADPSPCTIGHSTGTTAPFLGATPSLGSLSPGVATSMAPCDS
jgi:hypothetical protein